MAEVKASLDGSVQSKVSSLIHTLVMIALITRLQVGDRTWTSSQPERTKMLAKDNVVKLILTDWETQPALFNAPFPQFGGSDLETHTKSILT